MDRLLTIYVRDQNDKPLPGADVAVILDNEDEPFAEVTASEGHATVQIPKPRSPVRLVATYRSERPQTVDLALDSDHYTFRFNVTGEYSKMSLWRIILHVTIGITIVLAIIGAAFYLGLQADVLPLAVGVVLLLAALVLAFTFRDPTLLQAQLIRSTFALGAGGLATQIPGMLNIQANVQESAAITASGAIAVYIVTFFFVPARDKSGSQ